MPYADGAYYTARPTIGIQQANLGFTFNERLGVHAGLKALQPLWQQNKLAIVEGVGYDNSSLSHFQAMDIWQTLDLSGQGTTGWLGKYVAGLVDKDGHPFQSLSVGTALPTALRAINADVPVVSDPSQYRLAPDPTSGKGQSAADPRVQALLKLYNTYPDSSPYAALLDLLNQTAQGAVQGSQQLSAAVSQYKAAVTYPTSNFAKGLQVLAEVIVQGLGLRVGYVTIGGFDTHADQDNPKDPKPTHTTLLTTSPRVWRRSTTTCKRTVWPTTWW